MNNYETKQQINKIYAIIQEAKTLLDGELQTTLLRELKERDNCGTTAISEVQRVHKKLNEALVVVGETSSSMSDHS